MLRALTRINIFLRHCLWELSVYITWVKGKRAAERGGGVGGEAWEVKVGCTLRL